MKYLLALLLFATPAQANLQDEYRTQQDQELAEHNRRIQLCENHMNYVQYKKDHIYYRISRGDLYQIVWTGYREFGSFTLGPHPCRITLMGKLNEDKLVCLNNSWGCDPRSTTRWTIEGNELISYSTVNWGGGRYTGEIRRNVIGTAL